ncbi:hypothetical protein J1605_013346 [Eschrichtius robustus]|uniref:Ig-like domain-containing protein n=1 Tax=Eschrichtius robustus TaxID=9764 RepID=A0AB34GJW4_ESCRO|nr:hypothetical protein J1605_013346 [Eschrichtius robustus]
MLLLPQVLVVASLGTYTSGDIQITQRITSITKTKGNTASLECQIKTDMLKKSVYIHWYRQKPEQPLNRILYISSNENFVHEQGISEERYEARKWPSNSLLSLRIHGATEEDAALYYCACWDTRAPEPQLLKPMRLESMLRNKRSHRNEKLAHHNEE